MDLFNQLFVCDDRSIVKQKLKMLNETDMGHVTADLVFDEINVVFWGVILCQV